MKDSIFFLALKDAFRTLSQNWRMLVIPGFCIAVILWICFVIVRDLAAYHRGTNIETRSLLFLFILITAFLMEAGSINLLRQFSQNKDGGWKHVLEVFSWRRLSRLLVASIWLYVLGLIVSASLFFLFQYLQLNATWILALIIPLQFYVILIILENPEYRAWRCFCHGFRETISQRWEVWGVWIWAWVSYRIIGRVAWVLTWWIPNRFAGLEVHGYWIILSFILLMGCVFAFGVFLLLSLRKMRVLRSCHGCSNQARSGFSHGQTD
ncbi:MAG TPA: hypothetical protein VNQ90_03775 [Chthoniobacteraceae bacterium]|nr:hypothetical protein [Chthoniobacteraceae bacterium]